MYLTTFDFRLIKQISDHKLAVGIAFLQTGREWTDQEILARPETRLVMVTVVFTTLGAQQTLDESSLTDLTQALICLTVIYSWYKSVGWHSGLCTWLCELAEQSDINRPLDKDRIMMQSLRSWLECSWHHQGRASWGPSAGHKLASLHSFFTSSHFSNHQAGHQTLGLQFYIYVYMTNLF